MLLTIIADPGIYGAVCERVRVVSVPDNIVTTMPGTPGNKHARLKSVMLYVHVSMCRQFEKRDDNVALTVKLPLFDFVDFLKNNADYSGNF